MGAQAGTKAKCQSPADLSTPLCSTPQPLQSSAQLRSSGALPALTPCTLLACFLNHSVPPAPLHTRHPHRATFHPSYPSHLLTLHLTHPHTPDSLHLLLYPHTALSPLTPHPSPLHSHVLPYSAPHTPSHTSDTPISLLTSHPSLPHPRHPHTRSPPPLTPLSTLHIPSSHHLLEPSLAPATLSHLPLHSPFPYPLPAPSPLLIAPPQCLLGPTNPWRRVDSQSIPPGRVSWPVT